MSKFGPFALGARERSRLAWRSRVDTAARVYSTVCVVAPGGDRYLWFMRRLLRHLGMRNPFRRPAKLERGMFPEFRRPEADALTDALAAPRPWRSARKPDPRNHYSRSHRRACKGCRLMGRWLRSAQYAARLDPAEPYVARFHKFTRNPHGRSGR